MPGTDDTLVKYKEELIELLHKSQDAFERQLSYISAGSLALSIGFISDVVKNIKDAHCKWLLDLGWIFLCLTLLVNCISHIRAADLHNRTIKDINHSTYNHIKVESRYKEVSRVNWITVFSMVAGIICIVIFISINIFQ